MSANTYFVGGEDIDFKQATNTGGHFGFFTGAGQFRSDWSRGSLSIENVLNGANFPDAPGFAGFLEPNELMDSISNFWFHAQYWIEDHRTSSGYNTFGFASPDGVWRLAVQGTGTAGQWKLVKRDSAGSLTTLVTSDPNVFGPAILSALVQIDVRINYSTSGSFDLYINRSNTSSLSYSGDLTTDGATELNNFFLGTHWSSNIAGWSEILVSDVNTRPMGVLTKQPVADGVTQDWSGSASDVNEINLNDSTFISTDIADKIAEFTCPTTIPTGSWDVETVWQRARINCGLTGPQNFEFVARPAAAGADFFSGSQAAAAGLANYVNAWDQNPDTTAAWVVTDFDSGFNLGIKSIT